MPKPGISPSQQENNQYTGGGTGYSDSEEFWMRKLGERIDARIAKQGWGIDSVVINKGSWSANAVESNRLNITEHIALHSDAGGGHGTTVFFHTGSAKGEKLAKALYPFIASASNMPDRGIKASSMYGELNKTDAPAIIIEFAFHDNAAEAEEIRKSINEFAEAVVKGLARYYGKTYKPEVIVPPVPVEEFLEVRFHISAKDKAKYSALGVALSDVVRFYPTTKDSWKAWTPGV